MKRIAFVLASLLLIASLAGASVFSRQVTVTASATRLDANTSGEQITVVNQATTSVFLGPSTVTTAGFELKAGASLSLFLSTNEKLYSITAGASNRVDVLESGR